MKQIENRILCLKFDEQAPTIQNPPSPSDEWDILPLVKKIAACVRKTQHELRAFPTMESDDEEYDPRVYERYQNTCHTIYKKYASSIFYSVALRPILSESDMECHMRRVRSEKIDYEAVNEPNSKRRSTGLEGEIGIFTDWHLFVFPFL